MKNLPSPAVIQKLIKSGTRLPLATQNYPSRGQTAVQELYQTKIGKLFRKRVSERNHRECQIPVKSGTLAEREFWAYRLAHHLDLYVPPLALLDDMTTVQLWLDLPDAKQYKTSQGVLSLSADNVISCALFDWITGQIDRHDANYLYNMATQQITLIDSGHAFLKYDGSMPDYLCLFEAIRAPELLKRLGFPLFKKIKSLDPKIVKKCVPLRDTVESAALSQRLSKVKQVNTIQDLIRLYRG